MKTWVIGNATWIAIAAMEEKHNVKPFFSAVQKFYDHSKKMIQKCPFGDTHVLLINSSAWKIETRHCLVISKALSTASYS